MAARKPIFCVVLSGSEQWLIEAEWPDGTIEQIDAFKAYFDAPSPSAYTAERCVEAVTQEEAPALGLNERH